MSSTFQCNPALRRRDGESCLPPEARTLIHNAWNKTHSNSKGKSNGKSNGKTKGKNTTRKNGRQRAGMSSMQNLRNLMREHYKCSTEFCMVSKMPGVSDAERKKLKQYFRPEKPTDWDAKPTLWLDSYNIEDVMRQYEAAVPSFEFIGPVPIDFDAKSEDTWGKCIVDELCKLDIQASKRAGKTKIGIVFNLDPHDEPGSHWVCAFIDIDAGAAYYFDSYGFEPEKEIVALLKRCKDQGITNIYYNDIRHQRKGSECGMYSLFCIVSLLNGLSFYDICTNVIDDNTMNTLRDVFFSEENPKKEAIQFVLKKFL